jgi:hypothetical protein
VPYENGIRKLRFSYVAHYDLILSVSLVRYHVS